MINNISHDRRRHERKDIITTIEYSIKGSYAQEAFEGVITNISETGLCILTTNPLSKDEKIKIKIKNEAFVNCQTADVRWSSQNKNLYYIVGLECT